MAAELARYMKGLSGKYKKKAGVVDIGVDDIIIISLEDCSTLRVRNTIQYSQYI